MKKATYFSSYEASTRKISDWEKNGRGSVGHGKYGEKEIRKNVESPSTKEKKMIETRYNAVLKVRRGDNDTGR